MTEDSTVAGRSRNQCFTLNNWTPADVEEIKSWKAKYVVFGAEVGEEEKTPHLQGYVEWPEPMRLTALRKLCSGRCSWRDRKAPTGKQAADYCKKGEQPKAEWEELKTAGPQYGLNAKVVEVGTISSPGKRSDLEAVASMVVAKVPMADVAGEHPGTFVRYHKGLVALQAVLLKHREGPPYVEWRWGPTGSGKTRYCVDKHPSHYIKDGTQWWDGYTQQEAIVIDDFTPSGGMGFRDLLRLLDRYAYSGQYKGGYVPVNSPFIYITADEHPSYYGWSAKELSQLLRRINAVTFVGTPPEPGLAAS